MRETRVFISHSTLDEDIAQLFAKFLTSTDEFVRHNIFISSDKNISIGAGDNVTKDIKKALKQADIIIYLLTENFFKSVFCLSELGAGWIEQNDSKVLFPILLSDTEEVRNKYHQSPLSMTEYIKDPDPTIFLNIFDDNNQLNSYINNSDAKKRTGKIKKDIQKYCADHFDSQILSNSDNHIIKYKHSFYAKKVANEFQKHGFAYCEPAPIINGDFKMKIDFELDINGNRHLVESKYSKNYSLTQENSDYYNGWIVVNKQMSEKVDTWIFVLEGPKKLDYLVIPKISFDKILSQKKLIGNGSFHFYIHSANGIKFEDKRENVIDLTTYLNAWTNLSI